MGWGGVDEENILMSKKERRGGRGGEGEKRGKKEIKEKKRDEVR